METTGETVTGKGSYTYGAFHKVCEARDAFYLYVDSRQALLIPKRSMDAAAVVTLSLLLEDKLGKKFVKCY